MSPSPSPTPPHTHTVEVASTAMISQLSMSACSALGDIFRSGPLPLPVGPGDQSTDKGETGDKQPQFEDVMTHGDNELTQRVLVTCLSKILKSAREIKVCLCVKRNS